MPALDHNAPFLISAFVITVAVLGGYALYLRSRVRGYSGRKVAAAAPSVSTAQAAKSASGPTTS